MKTFISALILIPFTLAATAATAEESKPKVRDRNAPDYVRCTKSADTGSLVPRRKTCHTNAEWDKIETEQRRNADEVIDASRRSITTNGG